MTQMDFEQYKFQINNWAYPSDGSKDQNEPIQKGQFKYRIWCKFNSDHSLSFHLFQDADVKTQTTFHSVYFSTEYEQVKKKNWGFITPSHPVVITYYFSEIHPTTQNSDRTVSILILNSADNQYEYISPINPLNLEKSSYTTILSFIQCITTFFIKFKPKKIKASNHTYSFLEPIFEKWFDQHLFDSKSATLADFIAALTYVSQEKAPNNSQQNSSFDYITLFVQYQSYISLNHIEYLLKMMTTCFVKLRGHTIKVSRNDSSLYDEIDNNNIFEEVKGLKTDPQCHLLIEKSLIEKREIYKIKYISLSYTNDSNNDSVMIDFKDPLNLPPEKLNDCYLVDKLSNCEINYLGMFEKNKPEIFHCFTRPFQFDIENTLFVGIKISNTHCHALFKVKSASECQLLITNSLNFEHYHCNSFYIASDQPINDEKSLCICYIYYEGTTMFPMGLPTFINLNEYSENDILTFLKDTKINDDPNIECKVSFIRNESTLFCAVIKHSRKRARIETSKKTKPKKKSGPRVHKKTKK
ncbi:hypothetical protein TRFO_31303 [Tritrichomonas foetus]|uniref:Uncharacterized protein n=1 Tax=Tritrichomonas foetus TaxID=1144522 RepID=A0A1J4JRT5_9EUKA|nr:hypothetical protein TRFO_31303 [Tritrichomonas foetus]|eukprot:OHT01747.1 hypothetical protein TRFO_31303 [Tritrichomonas foetus]